MSGFQALFALLEQNLSKAKVLGATAKIFKETEAPSTLEFDYYESVYKPFLEDAKAYAFKVALQGESKQFSAYKNLAVVAEEVFKRCLSDADAEKAFEDYEESLMLPKLKAAAYHRQPAASKRVESVSLIGIDVSFSLLTFSKVSMVISSFITGSVSSIGSKV